MNKISKVFARLKFLWAFLNMLMCPSRAVRFYKNQASGMTNAIVEAAVVVIICSVFSVTVLPLLINGSDGGIGEQTLPLFQTALLVAGIFAAIGLIVYAAKHSIGGGK